MNKLPDNLSDEDRLLLHLAGELPEADAAHVRARLASDPAVQAFGRSFETIDGLLRTDAQRADARASASAAAAARFVAAAVHDAAPPSAPARRLWLPPRWTVYPAAAALLVAALMGGWWYQVHDEFNQPGPGYVDRTPSVLVLRGEPDVDLNGQSDDEIAEQFESMIPDRRFDPDAHGDPEGRMVNQLATLDYLDSSLRRSMR